MASVSRTINVFYNEAPEITNLTAPDVCENSSFTLIEGVNFDIENEQSFTFSTLDNTGVIANNGTSNVTFTPSNAQITQGFIDVVLTLTPPPLQIVLKFLKLLGLIFNLSPVLLLMSSLLLFVKMNLI